MPNVVLVDDEIWALRDLESLLTPYPHYRILGSFTNSLKAFDAILAMHPDVVFTDLRMAEMDGRELINNIHTHSPETVLVIISAYSDFSVAREALHRNVLDYLLKPLSPDSMAALIRRLDAHFSSAGKKQLSPSALFEVQLRDAALYTGCCVLAFPEDIQPDATLRQLYGLLSSSCSLIWASEPDSNERILLLSAPPSSIEGVLPDLPASAGVSRIYSNFSDFALMRQEALISRICAFRYAALPQVAAIQSYLASHFSQEINLDNLARHFYISKNYLCDVFRSTTGATVMTFLMEIRLALAAHRIRTSPQSIREIADSVGYSDSAYFSRAFKKLYGVSPESYRRSQDG